MTNYSSSAYTNKRSVQKQQMNFDGILGDPLEYLIHALKLNVLTSRMKPFIGKHIQVISNLKYV